MIESYTIHYVKELEGGGMAFKKSVRHTPDSLIKRIALLQIEGNNVEKVGVVILEGSILAEDHIPKEKLSHPDLILGIIKEVKNLVLKLSKET